MAQLYLGPRSLPSCRKQMIMHQIIVSPVASAIVLLLVQYE